MKFSDLPAGTTFVQRPGMAIAVTPSPTVRVYVVQGTDCQPLLTLAEAREAIAQDVAP